MGPDRVVTVIEKRFFNAFRNDYRAGKVHHRPDALLVEDALDQRAVRDRPFVKGNLLGHDVAGAVGQVVDDRNRPAGVGKGENGVASDIAGAAGYEHWGFGHWKRSLAATATCGNRLSRAQPQGGLVAVDPGAGKRVPPGEQQSQEAPEGSWAGGGPGRPCQRAQRAAIGAEPSPAKQAPEQARPASGPENRRTERDEHPRVDPVARMASSAAPLRSRDRYMRSSACSWRSRPEVRRVLVAVCRTL